MTDALKIMADAQASSNAEELSMLVDQAKAVDEAYRALLSTARQTANHLCEVANDLHRVGLTGPAQNIGCSIEVLREASQKPPTIDWFSLWSTRNKAENAALNAILSGSNAESATA